LMIISAWAILEASHIINTRLPSFAESVIGIVIDQLTNMIYCSPVSIEQCR
jgi:hypothetical protein